jgi:four helix bundle protein
MTAADRRRLYVIARGSLYETEHWLLTAERRGLLKADLSAKVDEVGRTLSGLIARPGP